MTGAAGRLHVRDGVPSISDWAEDRDYAAGFSSRSAQALATPVSGDFPSNVAAPVLLTISDWLQEDAFRSSANFSVASDAFRNFSAENGARAFTTASVDCCRAMSLADLFVTQPPQLKPTIMVAADPMTADQTACLVHVGSSDFPDKLMCSSIHGGKNDFFPAALTIARRRK